MNKYFIILSFVVFVAWSGFMYYEGCSKEKVVCVKEDAQHDLYQSNIIRDAQNGVINTIGQQQTITQEIEHAYELKQNSIDSIYSANLNSLQSASVAASNSLPAIACSASRTDAPASRPFHTTVFGLSPKECDENTEQLYGLRDWVRAQQAIKQPGMVK